MESRFKRLSGKNFFIVVLPVLAAAVIAVLVAMLLNSSQKLELEGNWFQSYAGAVSRYSDGGVISYSFKTGEVSYNEMGMKRSVSELPIYSEDGSSMLLSADFVFYSPRTGETYLMDRFTELSIENDTMTASLEGETVSLYSGYLYDGDDLYIFLEPINVTLNGYTFTLPAFSYVEAVYGNGMVAFNYETGENMVEQPKLEITAAPDDESYQVSLIADSMVYDNGDKILLFASPELLDSVYDKSEQ